VCGEAFAAGGGALTDRQRSQFASGFGDSIGGALVPVMLLISILLGLIPLAGIAWIVLGHAVTSVDGLFMSLILLTLSGVFFLNAAWEVRDRVFGKGKAAKAVSTTKTD
jgi:hypothetical protein